MKLLFLLRDLDYGGTQRQVLTLAGGLQQRGHDAVVAVFYGGGALEKTAKALQVKVISLEKRGRWDLVAFIVKGVKLVRQQKPDIIYSCLDGPNIVALGLRVCWQPARLVWGIRSAYTDWRCYNRLGYCAYRISSWLSHRPDAVIFNSEAGKQYHASNGFCRKNAHVIQNGIDTKIYTPDSGHRESMRACWRVGQWEFLIGSIGRFDGMKDFGTFLRAAKILSRTHTDIIFVCIGGDEAEDYRRSLVALSSELDIEQHIRFVDFSYEMCSIYNALDIVVSSSLGEGFSNVLGEAMACGTPCVATDVGDSAKILGDTGYVVPPKDPKALADALEKMIKRVHDEAPMLFSSVRDRIERKFSVETMLDKTEDALIHAVERGGRQRVS